MISSTALSKDSFSTEDDQVTTFQKKMIHMWGSPLRVILMILNFYLLAFLSSIGLTSFVLKIFTKTFLPVLSILESSKTLLASAL